MPTVEEALANLPPPPAPTVEEALANLPPPPAPDRVTTALDNLPKKGEPSFYDQLSSHAPDGMITTEPTNASGGASTQGLKMGLPTTPGDVFLSTAVEHSPLGIGMKLASPSVPKPQLDNEALTKMQNPWSSKLGGLFGDLITYSTAAEALGATPLAGQIADGVSGITNTIVRTAAARSLMGAATFGGVGLAQEAARQKESGQLDIPSLLSRPATDALFGGILGVAGTIPKPVLRTITEMAVGGGSSALQGASPADIAQSVALFGIFGAMNRMDLTPELKQSAQNAALQHAEQVALSRGVEPELAPHVADYTIKEVIKDQVQHPEWFDAKGEPTIQGWDGIAKSMKEVVDRASDITSITPRPENAPPIPPPAQRELTPEEVNALPVGQEAGTPKGKPKPLQEDSMVKVNIKNAIDGGADTIEMTPQQLLNFKLKNQQKASLQGFRAGQAEARQSLLADFKEKLSDMEDVKTRVVAYATASLPKDQRGQFLNMVKNAETSQDLAKAFVRIDNASENYQKGQTINDIYDTYKAAIKSDGMAQDYKEKLTDLLSDFSKSSMSKASQERVQKSLAYFDQAAANGQDVEMPQRLAQLADRLGRRPLKDLSVKELDSLHDEVMRTVQLGTTKQSARVAKAQNEHDMLMKELLSGPITKVESKTLGQSKLEQWMGQGYNKAIEGKMAIMPMDVRFDNMGSGAGTYNDAPSRIFKRDVDTHMGDFYVQSGQRMTPLAQMAQDLKLTKKNMEHINLFAYKMQLEDTQGHLEATGYTPQQIRDARLTPEEMRYYQKGREVLDAITPELQRLAKERNMEFVPQKNYWPIQFAKDTSELPVIERFDRILRDPTANPTSKSTSGFMNERVGGSKPLNMNAQEVLMNHIENATYLTNMSQVLERNAKLAKSDAFLQAYGDVNQKDALNYIDTLARKGGAAGQTSIRWLDWLRRMGGAGTLGVNIGTGLVHMTSLPNAVPFIGWDGIWKGMTHLSDPEWRSFIAQFPEFMNRVGAKNKNMFTYGEEGLGSKVESAAYWHIRNMDKVATAATVAGAYEHDMARRGLTVDLSAPPDPQAMTYAHLVMRRTRASWEAKDEPQVFSRGALYGNRSIARMVHQFQQVPLNFWSLATHDVGISDLNGALGLATSIAATAGVRLAWSDFKNAILDRTPKEEDTMTKRVVDELLHQVPFIGQLAQGIKYQDIPIPTLEGIGNLFKGKYLSGVLHYLPGGDQALTPLAKALKGEMSDESTVPKMPALPKLQRAYGH